jgi:hypothetical protein
MFHKCQLINGSKAGTHPKPLKIYQWDKLDFVEIGYKIMKWPLHSEVARYRSRLEFSDNINKLLSLHQGRVILQVQISLIKKICTTELISCTKFKLHQNGVTLHGQNFMPRINWTITFLDHVQEMWNAYIILVRKPDGKKSHLENVDKDWRTLLKWILRWELNSSGSG